MHRRFSLSGVLGQRWRYFIFPVVLIGLWQLTASLTDPLLVPSPLATWDAVAQLARDGELWHALAVSLRRVSVGVLLAALIGVPFGAALGISRAFKMFFGAALPGIAATSAAIWSVLGLLWFGLNDAATIFVVAMATTPLFAVNIRDAVLAVDVDLMQMVRSMGYGPLKVAMKVLAPSILPGFFSGLRLAASFGWRSGLVAEALISPSGAGFRLKQAIDLMHTADVFAWGLSVVLIMVAVERLILDPLEAWMFRWRKQRGPLNTGAITYAA